MEFSTQTADCNFDNYNLCIALEEIDGGIENCAAICQCKIPPVRLLTDFTLSNAAAKMCRGAVAKRTTLSLA
jgi:hypothetical protein